MSLPLAARLSCSAGKGDVLNESLFAEAAANSTGGRGVNTNKHNTKTVMYRAGARLPAELHVVQAV